MKINQQFFLTLFSIIIAVILIGFGIAGIAVVLGFLMIPTGIYYFVRGIQNLSSNKKTIIIINNTNHDQLIINPFWEILAGVLLFIIGFKLTEAFIGIALIGVGIYFLALFLDRNTK